MNTSSGDKNDNVKEMVKLEFYFPDKDEKILPTYKTVEVERISDHGDGEYAALYYYGNKKGPYWCDVGCVKPVGGGMWVGLFYTLSEAEQFFKETVIALKKLIPCPRCYSNFGAPIRIHMEKEKEFWRIKCSECKRAAVIKADNTKRLELLDTMISIWNDMIRGELAQTAELAKKWEKEVDEEKLISAWNLMAERAEKTIHE